MNEIKDVRADDGERVRVSFSKRKIVYRSGATLVIKGCVEFVSVSVSTEENQETN